MRSGYLPMTGKFSGALPLGRQDFLRGDIRVKKKKEKKKKLKADTGSSCEEKEECYTVS